MKAGIFFTGSGPIVILTSYEAFDDKGFIEKLSAKGISKFIAYEVPINEVRAKYGQHYKLILNDLHQKDDLRVLDYDGHRIFKRFAMNQLYNPFYYET